LFRTFFEPVKIAGLPAAAVAFPLSKCPCSTNSPRYTGTGSQACIRVVDLRVAWVAGKKNKEHS